MMRALLVVALVLPSALRAQSRTPLDSLADAVTLGVERFADRRAAAADGYRRIGPDFPGMGEHWLHPHALLGGKIDAARPTLLIYATIAGVPKLLGAGFVTTTRGADSTSRAPGWPDAWHEHSGLLVDESGVAPGESTESSTHVWVLHVWTTLANPGGRFSPDNWALPFLRAGLPIPASVDADASRALALVGGGDGYLRDVLSDAHIRTLANAEAVDSIIARARTGAGAVARRGDFAVQDLRGIWTSLSASLRAQLGPDVDRYLVPPHQASHSAHQHPARLP
jgi:hypothetical protein